MEGNETVVAPEIPRAYVISKYVLSCLVSLAIIVGNALTVLAVIISKKLRANSTNVFVASLAVSDGMIGFAVPFTTMFKLWNTPKIWTISICALIGPYYALFDISLLLLLAIGIDRFVAVVYPLSYKKWITRKRAIIASILIWIIQFALMSTVTCYFGSRVEVENFHPSAAQKLFPKEIFVFFVQTYVMVPVLGNVVLYLCIYAKMRKRNAVGATRSQATQTADRQVSQRTKAFTNMMALVLGYLILACIPYYMLVPLYDVTQPTTPAWYIYSFDLSIVLFYSNSFMNPLIYSWKNRDFRDAYKMILRWRREESDSQESGSSAHATNVM